MPTVPAPSPSSQYTPTTAEGSAPKGLGKDDFLKMFVAQLTHQNPMNPMSEMEFMGQMASFTTLEQITNLADQNRRVADSLASSNAIGLIGRTVTWTDESDQIHTGVVESVTTKDGKPSLTVAGIEDVDPSTISQVS